MNKVLKTTTRLLAIVLILATIFTSNFAFAASGKMTLSNAPELYEYVRLGYNNGTKGPIIITKAQLMRADGKGSKTTVWLVTLSGTEHVLQQATNFYTDLRVGTNLVNDYFDRATAAVLKKVPRGAKIVFAGHSLGGMVAQQLAANPKIRLYYNVINTVTFGSPLIAAGFREGKIQRLGHMEDPVPLMSTNTLITPVRALLGLNREGHLWDYKDPFDAHGSYGLTKYWGDYDVLGFKGGEKGVKMKLVLDLSTQQYFKAKTYFGLPF